MTNVKNILTKRSEALLDGAHAIILLDEILWKTCSIASTSVTVLPVPTTNTRRYYSQAAEMNMISPLLATAREGYVFRSVCQGVWSASGGGGSASRGVCLLGGLPPEGGSASRGSASRGLGRAPSPPMQTPLTDILLECILVFTE